MPDNLGDGDGATEPPDLSDVEGDYSSGGVNVEDMDEATQQWLAGNTRPARELGLSESDINRWLYSRTAKPMRMAWGQDMHSATPENADLRDVADGYADTMEEIRRKGDLSR